MTVNDQYYTADPTSESKPTPCAFPYRGYGLNFMTDAGVFSKGELDVGSRLLLDALPALSGDVLDLGCGWGAIGIAVVQALADILSLVLAIPILRKTRKAVNEAEAAWLAEQAQA